MKNLFDLALAEDTKQRIMHLSPDSKRQWGQMTVTQALAHCTHGLQMAMGTINPKRAPFPASILGIIVKRLVMENDKPLRRNSPSAPELFSDALNESDLEREQAALIAAIDEFVVRGRTNCSKSPHPFFGPLNPQQWAILMYKHLDHHLRQFGA